MSDPTNEMAELIRATFRKSGLSMKQLAERSGVYYASIHGLIVGGRNPALSTAAKVCKVLGLELRPVQQGKRKRR